MQYGVEQHLLYLLPPAEYHVFKALIFTVAHLVADHLDRRHEGPARGGRDGQAPPECLGHRQHRQPLQSHRRAGGEAGTRTIFISIFMGLRIIIMGRYLFVVIPPSRFPPKTYVARDTLTLSSIQVIDAAPTAGPMPELSEAATPTVSPLTPPPAPRGDSTDTPRPATDSIAVPVVRQPAHVDMGAQGQMRSTIEWSTRPGVGFVATKEEPVRAPC
jgi:hypothetical protein